MLQVCSNDYDFCWNFNLLKLLFMNKDVRNMKQCLGDACPDIKSKLLLSIQGSLICKSLVDGCNLDLLEFFIKECASSEDDVVHLKDKVESCYFGDVLNNIIQNIHKIFDLMKRKKGNSQV